MKNNKKLKLSKYKIKYFFKYTLWAPFRCIKNYFFCLKYPFWRSRNVWTDKPCGYDFTKYEEIPIGWRKAFGKQLSKELKEALIKDGLLKNFRFTQIKEKWGKLCLYNFGVGPESDKVISKYELMSRGYCIECGKPARYVTSGYVSYLCEDCYDSNCGCHYKDGATEEELKEIEKQKRQDRLKVKDMPSITRYRDGKTTKVNILDEYGLDFYKLWGIEKRTRNTEDKMDVKE